MEEKTTGTVVSVKKQWWLKVNTKAVRLGTMDGAVFPHIIKIRYTANGIEYIKGKWLGARHTPPAVGETVAIAYSKDKPSKIRLL